MIEVPCVTLKGVRAKLCDYVTFALNSMTPGRKLNSQFFLHPDTQMYQVSAAIATKNAFFSSSGQQVVSASAGLSTSQAAAVVTSKSAHVVAAVSFLLPIPPSAWE